MAKKKIDAAALLLADLKLGKTPEQCRCIDYLYSEDAEKKKGCLRGKKGDMDMNEYLRYVSNMANGLNLKEMAMAKIGLDESQISEIPPVHFSSFVWSGDGIRRKWEKQGDYYKAATNKYTVTWIFFSADQIYTFNYTFDTTSDDVTVLTRDFFYKDITCIKTQHDIEGVRRKKTKGCGCMQKQSYYFDHMETDKLEITVPGADYYFWVDTTETTEQTIQATKAMIREKKNA